MKVLVVGNGGREHAIAWKLLQCDRVREIFCIPGNGGTAALPRCRNLALSVTDFEGMKRFALVNNIGLIVVGPEVPLAAGITDALRSENLTVFGPTQAGAQIESSKAWAKALMQEANIPTARSSAFTDRAAAIRYLESQTAPIVVKADGLAAGKGVTVAESIDQAKAAIEAAFDGQFGAAGNCVVIEEFLAGQEVSVLALTDGLTIRPLLPAQDHKRIGAGDTGANTGGMGAYAPAPIATPDLMQRIEQKILEPAIATLKNRGIDYRGILYAGLMITPTGDPKVIEFNCRFGDPEAQVILPLLETPIDRVLLACAQQQLEKLPPLEWKSEVCACVVMAAGGYPDRYRKGLPITGIDRAEAQGAIVFQAGTVLKQNQLFTEGGRVLNVVAIGENFDRAFETAYQAIEAIEFEEKYYRPDIGYRVRQSPTASQ